MCIRMIALLLTLASLAAAQLETAPLKSRRAADRYRRVVNILETKRVTVNWDDVTIREAVADLRRQTGLNFVISSAAGEAVDEEISCKLRNIPAGPVLHVLGRRDVVFQHRHGVIWVTSREEATRRAAILRIYDTRGLFYVPPDFPGPRLGLGGSGTDLFEEASDDDADSNRGIEPEEAIDIIRGATGEANWELPGVSITLAGGRLLVRHTPRMQRRVRGLLAMLGLI